MRAINTISIGLLTSVLTFSVSAQDPTLTDQANAIFQRARDVSQPVNIAPATSYTENGTFTLYGVAARRVSGTVRKYVVDSKNWIEEIRAAGYQKILAQKGDDTYNHENADFTPLLIEKLQIALAPDLVIAESEKVSKVKKEKIGGANAACTYLTQRQKSFEPESHRLCFDAGTGTLVLDERTYRTTVWSEYAKLGNGLLPGHIEISEHGTKVIEANLSYQPDPALTPAALKLPSGIAPQPHCSKLDPPEVLRKNDPAYPIGYKDPNMTVVLDALVGSDGHVHKTQVVQSAGQPFNDSAEQAVRNWEFSPAKCDGVPQEKAIKIEVNFHCCSRPPY